MGISTVMVTVATTQSVLATAVAARMREERCKIVMPVFKAEAATVAEMREYSECVETLYPHPLPSSTIIVFKILFVAALLGGAIASWKEKQKPYGTLEDTLFAAFLGSIVTPVVLAFLGGIVVGILWLFS